MKVLLDYPKVIWDCLGLLKRKKKEEEGFGPPLCLIFREYLVITIVDMLDQSTDDRDRFFDSSMEIELIGYLTYPSVHYERYIYLILTIPVCDVAMLGSEFDGLYDAVAVVGLVVQTQPFHGFVDYQDLAFFVGFQRCHQCNLSDYVSG